MFTAAALLVASLPGVGSASSKLSPHLTDLAELKRLVAARDAAMLPLVLPFRVESRWSADRYELIDGVQVVARGRGALYQTRRTGNGDFEVKQIAWDGVDSWVISEDAGVAALRETVGVDARALLVRSRGPALDLLRLYLPANFGITYAGGLWSDLLSRTPRAEIIGTSTHTDHSCIDVIVETALGRELPPHGYLAPIVASFDLEQSSLALSVKQYHRVGSSSELTRSSSGLWLFDGIYYGLSFDWSVDGIIQTESGPWIPISGWLNSPASPPIRVTIDPEGVSVAAPATEAWLEVVPQPGTFIIDMVERKNKYCTTEGKTVNVDDVRFESLLRSVNVACKTPNGLIKSNYPYDFDDAGCGPNALLFLLLIHGIDVAHADLIRSLPVDLQSRDAQVPMSELQRLARDHGLAASPCEASTDELRKVSRWAVAQVIPKDHGVTSQAEHHFIVVFPRETDVLCVDPPRLMSTLNWKEFGERYTGYAMFVAQDDNALSRSIARSQGSFVIAIAIAVTGIGALLIGWACTKR